MDAGDGVLLLGVIVIATLFVGLVWVGRAYYRLSQYTLDASRIKSLIQLQPTSDEVEAAARRLWTRLQEDSEQLRRIEHRIRSLIDREDEPRESVP